MGAGRALRVLWESFRYCRTPGGETVPPLPRLLRLLAASRLCVLPMTWYAVFIGGLIAYMHGTFDILLFALLLLGFSAAHLADNLLNDLTDALHGVDEPGYFRAQYGPHPVLDGIVGPRGVLGFVAGILLFDALLAAYLSLAVTPLVALLAALGVLSMTLYAGYPLDAKRAGLGEALVVIVWGPVIAGGTALALTANPWLVLNPAYAGFAFSVGLVLFGKHLDKYEYDRAKGVKTLPVRLGLKRSKRAAAIAALTIPLTASLGIYAATGSEASLIPLASITVAAVAARMLHGEKPGHPPPLWRAWPLWYVAAAYAVMDSVGRTTVLALLAHITGYTAHLALLAIVFEVVIAVSLYKRTSFTPRIPT